MSRKIRLTKKVVPSNTAAASSAVEFEKKRGANLDIKALNKQAIEKIKAAEEEEIKKCILKTQGTQLSAEEYKNASEEFKKLIEIPWNKKPPEPIYIWLEFNEDGELHPELAAIKAGIEKGLPYDAFINGSWGETWPLLLRLYYGLKSGFKISIEQLHTIMELTYWRGLGLEAGMMPLFQADKKTLSKTGKTCIEARPYLKSGQDQELVQAMMDAKIPEAERSVLAVKLDALYFRFIIYACSLYPQLSSSRLGPLLAHDKKYGEPQLGAYSHKKMQESIQLSGAKMFGMLITSALISNTKRGLEFFTLSDKHYLLLCTQTMLNRFYHVIAPDRNLVCVRRLGRFNPMHMEMHSSKNQRAINLYAPGISNPHITHGAPVFPAIGLAHDSYHMSMEGEMSFLFYSQAERVRHMLRSCTEETVCSTELFRSTDRERPNGLKNNADFLDLLKYIFSFQADGPKTKLFFSSVIVLVDMILSPNHWPLYKQMGEQLINLLMHFNKQKPANHKLQVETFTQLYAKRTNNNHAFIAILLLCHFHLNDQVFSKALSAVSEEKPGLVLFAWRKMEHAHLYPVLLLVGRAYTLEKFEKIDSKQRLELLNKTIADHKASGDKPAAPSNTGLFAAGGGQGAPAVPTPADRALNAVSDFKVRHYLNPPTYSEEDFKERVCLGAGK